jgi:hypothetical protein
MIIASLSEKQNNRFNQVGYSILILAAIFSLTNMEITRVGMYLGIALLFDPFDYNVKFPDKKLKYRIILIANATLAILLFIYEISSKLIA